MKNPKIQFFLFLNLLLLLLPGLGRTQTALTLDECIKEASARNRDLLSAEQTVKAAENTKAASLGQFFPQINLNASISRQGAGGLSDAINGDSWRSSSTPPYNSQYTGPYLIENGPSLLNSNISLSVQQDIFSGFKDFAAVDQANAQLDLARVQLVQAKAQLSHDLKSNFYTLLYTQKEIDLLKEILDRQKYNMDLVEMNFKGGTDNKGSFLQAQAAYEEAKYELSQAQRALKVAQRQLAQALGRNQLDPIEVQGDFDVSTSPPNSPDFIKLILDTPAHQEALAQLHFSESGYVTARSAFFPTLSANASLSRSAWDSGGNQPGWSAGLQLSLPLFTGGKDWFDLQSAEESKKGAQDSLQSTDLKTESNLENAFASYQDAFEQIGVLQTQLTAAQTQEEIAKAEYLNGLLIFVNWNQIENSLTTQEKAQLSGFLSLETAKANWELTEGKGVIP